MQQKSNRWWRTSSSSFRWLRIVNFVSTSKLSRCFNTCLKHSILGGDIALRSSYENKESKVAILCCICLTICIEPYHAIVHVQINSSGMSNTCCLSITVSILGIRANSVFSHRCELFLFISLDSIKLCEIQSNLFGSPANNSSATNHVTSLIKVSLWMNGNIKAFPQLSQASHTD